MSSMVAIRTMGARLRAPDSRIITKLVVEGMFKATKRTEPAIGRKPGWKSFKCDNHLGFPVANATHCTLIKVRPRSAYGPTVTILAIDGTPDPLMMKSM